MATEAPQDIDLETATDRECVEGYTMAVSNTSLVECWASHIRHGRRVYLDPDEYRKRATKASITATLTRPSDVAMSATSFAILNLCFRESHWLEEDDVDRDGINAAARIKPLQSSPRLGGGEGLLPHAAALNGRGFDGKPLGKIYAWRSPKFLPGPPLRALDKVAKLYEDQYNSLNPSRQLGVEYCVNVVPQELTASLRKIRDVAKKTKVLFHYNGHGVSRPRNGHLFLPNNDPDTNDGADVKYEIGWIRRNLDFPMIFVADCNNAGTILRAFEHIQKTEDRQAQGRGLRSAAGPVAGSQMYGSHMDLSGGDPQQQQQQYGSPIGMGSPFNSINMGGMGLGDELRKQPQQRKIRDDFYFIGACEEGQLLPSHALLPNDILTACLTSPLKMSLLWFVITSRTIAVADIHPLLIHCLPGAFANKASPLGLLKWAFDSYMDSLARTVLSANDFSVLMRADPFLAGLYRGYFLAHYIISQLGGRVPVHPPIEDSSRNPIWQSWEWTLERTVAALHRTLRPLPSFGLSSPELREYLDPTNVTTLLSVAHRGRTIVNYVELAQSQQANIMTLLGSTPMVEEGVSIGATLDRLRCDVLELRPLEALGKLPFVIGWLQTLAYRDQGMRLLTRFLDLGETAVFEVALMDSFNRLLSRLIIHPQCTRLQPSFLFCFAKAVFADSTIVDDAARKLILPVAVKHLTNTTDIDEQSESAWQIPTLRAFASPAGQTTIASSLLLALILVPGSTFQIEREILKEGGFRGVCNALASIPAPVTPVTGASTAARKHSTTLYGVDALPSPGTTPPVTMGTPFTTFNGGVVGGVRTVHISVFYQKWITHEEAVDCVVQLRLSLMALFSSLLVHVNLHCGEEGVRMTQDQFSMRMDEFQQLMERLIDPLRLFLYESWPSVRLAATRTIGVVLAHGLLSEILQLRLLRIFLDRLHEELDPEIRLEQLGVLSTIMARCSPIVTTQAFQRIIGQSTAHRRRTIDFSLNGPWSTLHMQSLSVRSESVIHFQQDGIMSPFMLPAPDPEASGTLASSAAQHPSHHRRSKVHTVASTIDVTRGGQGGQPSSKRGQGGAEPFFLSGVASRPFVPRGRVPYAENRRDESTLEECHGRSLLFLLAALQSDFGLLRLHAERILDSLADAGVLLRRRDMTSALPTSSNSLSSFTQPTMMSSESVTQGIGTSMKWKLKFWVDKKATTAKAAAGNASSSAAHFQEDSSYHYDSGNDQGVGGQVDDTVRCLSIQPLSSSSPSSSPAQVSQEGGIQRSGVNMFVESNLQFLRHFAIPVILFLDQPCLTPTDDQDAHHAFSQAARADLAAFNEQASQLLRSHHDRDKTTFHDIACGQNFGPVSALAFHPTQHVLAVASGHTVHFVQLRNPESNDAFKSDVLRTSIVLPQVNRLFRKEECYRRLHSRSEYDSLNLLTNGEFEFYDDDNGGSRALYADVDVRSRAGTTEPGTTPRSIGGTLLNNNNNNDALPLPATMNSPINNLHMVDAAGSTPLLICVYGNGVVKICSDVLEQSRLKRAKEPFVLRVNSFDTAPIDGRATFQYCTSSYHGAAQHLRVTTVDGGVATWDLSVEQLVCHIGGASNGSFASCVFSHPTDPFRYGMGNKSILLFDTRSPTPSHTLQYGYEPNCLKGVWSGRYNSIVGGAFDRDGAVVFWDERKAGTPLLTRHTGSTKGTLKAARLAEIHPYQRNLMSVTVTGNDVLSQALSAKPYEKAHVGVSCIAYHPLDSLCAMGLSNGKVVLRIRKKTIVVAPEVLNMGAV